MILTIVFALCVMFLAILSYGLWCDFKQIKQLEELKAEREARKTNSIVDMQAV